MLIRFEMTAHISITALDHAKPVDRSVFLEQIVGLFVSPSIQSTQELETIAGAIIKLLREVSGDAAARAAQTLVLMRRLDEGMIAAFLRRHDHSTRIVLSEASWLPRTALLGATTGIRREEAAAITARSDLDTLIMHFLLNRKDQCIDLLLAENHALSMPSEIIGRLMIRAMVDGPLARSLLERPDLSVAQRGCLLPMADLKTALQIIGKVDQITDISVPKSPANDDPQHNFHATSRIKSGSLRDFYSECATIYRVSLGHIERLLSDNRGAGLALLLASLGLSANEITRTLKYHFDFESKIFSSDQFLKHIIDSINPESAQWIVRKIFSIALDENNKPTSIEEMIVKDSIEGKKSDAYSYAKQLRIA